MTTQAQREKRERENRARLERFAHEKDAATRQANQQRLTALNKQHLEHLHPVALPLLERDLDRVDPFIPPGHRLKKK